MGATPLPKLRLPAIRPGGSRHRPWQRRPHGLASDNEPLGDVSEAPPKKAHKASIASSSGNVPTIGF